MKRIAAPKAAVSGEVIQFGIADVGFNMHGFIIRTRTWAMPLGYWSAT